MSDITTIQWADTTVNPIMGCGGCELFPSSKIVLAAIDEAVSKTGTKVDSRAIFKDLINAVFEHSENSHPAHKPAVNTTNIWHLRKRFEETIRESHGDVAADAASAAIRKSITCYAAVLHLNKGANILDREGNPPDKDRPREVKTGYAPIFETVTQFNGRAEKTAKLKDLLGQFNPETPWKDRLPRMIFVSDMGDALSAKSDFPFLKADLMPAVQSDDGKRHLWLWLTKRPGRMAEFAAQIGGFPPNVCAMTTLTGPDAESLKRLADLKKVKASIRGLSIEPLWNRIPPSQLDLVGIDWLILGGESGAGLELTRPFALEWAEELREHCQKQGVAFFLKQLGRNPSRNGEVFRLKDPHGGEWDEWDKSLRIREFPEAFGQYRKDEITLTSALRPIQKVKRSKSLKDPTVTPEEKKEFKRQHTIVKKGVKAFSQVGLALAAIKADRLWRAGDYKTWEEYCRAVAGMSRVHAHRMIAAAEFVETLKTLPRGNILPQTEAQIRPLLRLPDADQQLQVWGTAVDQSKGDQPPATLIQNLVFEILHPDGAPEQTASRTCQRQDLIGQLRKVSQEKESWEQVIKLIDELEKLL